MIVTNIITSAICGGSSVAIVACMLDETLSPAERWTVLGALIAIVFAIVFRLINKVDTLGDTISKSLSSLGDTIAKDTVATIRLDDTTRQLITQIAESNRTAMAERDKIVMSIKEHIDLRYGPKE